MEKIYVLKCNKGKYYVGKTSNIDRRFAEHLHGEFGSEWTKHYPPQEVVKHTNMNSDFDETTTTLEYMKKFGIDNVRGAQWSNVKLTSEQRDHIHKLLNPNGCFNCGQVGHFANNCSKRNQSFGTSQAVQCFRCARFGHFANECTAMVCNRCGRDSHFEQDCYATTDIDGEMLDCARCGRDTHSANECFAKTDINGRRI